MTRNWGWFLDNTQHQKEAPSPITHKEPKPDNNQLSLEGDPSPYELSDETPPLANTLFAAL